MISNQFTWLPYPQLFFFFAITYFQRVFDIPEFGDLGYFFFFFHVLIDFRIRFGAVFASTSNDAINTCRCMHSIG